MKFHLTFNQVPDLIYERGKLRWIKFTAQFNKYRERKVSRCTSDKILHHFSFKQKGSESSGIYGFTVFFICGSWQGLRKHFQATCRTGFCLTHKVQALRQTGRLAYYKARPEAPQMIFYRYMRLHRSPHSDLFWPKSRWFRWNTLS